VSVWDELTPEQYAVMINATEEAYLNCVIYDYNLRVNGTQDVDAVVAPPISEQEVRSLIPRFTAVVTDLLARGWIEVYTPGGSWEDSEPMTPAQLTEVLGDPDSWITYPDRDNQMVMVVTSDGWDRLVDG